MINRRFFMIFGGASTWLNASSLLCRFGHFFIFFAAFSTVSVEAEGFFPSHEVNINKQFFPRNDTTWLNGVSAYDILLISKHLYGVAEFTNIYQYAAADANGDGKIDLTGGGISPDIFSLRQLILGITDTLAGQKSWRFFDENSPGSLPMVPPSGVFTLPNEFWQGAPSNTALNFIAVKIGDVNNS
ncbi:MAG TPA: hypothetical protein VK168_16990, partial [Saprospiraceae bacterium]|nr:hypothetical protein [Saprospiraceae bacterium]